MAKRKMVLMKNPFKGLTVKNHKANTYKEVIKDDCAEILIPDNQGNFFRLTDLCWQIACGKSIKEACLMMNLNPFSFMSMRHTHLEIDENVRYAIELAGEEDISHASRLMDNLDHNNFDVNKAKAQFLVWRGKQRYYRLYGDKPAALSIGSISNTVNNNKFDLSSVIRQLEHKPAEVTIDSDEYTCDD